MLFVSPVFEDTCGSLGVSRGRFISFFLALFGILVRSFLEMLRSVMF